MRQRKDSLFPTIEKVLTKRYYIGYKLLRPQAISKAKNSWDNPISVEKDKYDAWKEDIAVVNIFFAKETVTGHLSLSQCWFPQGAVSHFWNINVMEESYHYFVSLHVVN